MATNNNERRIYAYILAEERNGKRIICEGSRTMAKLKAKAELRANFEIARNGAQLLEIKDIAAPAKIELTKDKPAYLFKIYRFRLASGLRLDMELFKIPLL